MLKIILFIFVLLFIVLVIKIASTFLKESNKKRDEIINETSSIKEVIDELEEKVVYYKKVAEEGNLLAKSKLRFYEEELAEIKKVENKFKL